jgi:hypothetical protein
LGGADLSALFGVEIETETPTAKPAMRAAGRVVVKRSKTSTKKAPKNSEPKRRMTAAKPVAVKKTATPGELSAKKKLAKKPAAPAKPVAQKSATPRPKAKR